MLTRLNASWAGAVLTTVVAVTAAVAVVGHQGDGRVEVPFVLFSLLGGTGLALTGWLLVGLRAGNRLGHVLTVSGCALILEFALRELALVGLDGPDPVWARAAVWLSLVCDVVWFPLGVVLLLLLFPDGRPVSPRWRLLVRLVLVLAAARVALRALAEGPLTAESHDIEVTWAGVADTSGPTGLLDLLAILTIPVAIASLVVRFRRADPGGRQRLKPLAVAGLVVATGLLVQLVPGLRPAGVAVFVAGITVAVPLALAVGALRYRVWDLDPVVVGTLVYTGLAALVTGAYIVVVVVVSEVAGDRVATPDLLPSVVATAVVAVLFGPAKQQLERVARRLVYGVRSDPYAVLTALPHQLVDAAAVADVLPRTAQTIAAGLGVPAARVRCRLEDGTHLESWAPVPSVADAADLVVLPVRHAGSEVGDVAVLVSPDRPLGAGDQRLLGDLAAQAGPALRAVALDAALRGRLDLIESQAEELRESRQRIVEAQVGERRRLERDIHDGAQQQLVGLAVLIRQAEELVGDDADGAARTRLVEAGDHLGRCIDGLRELARGIYPPLLTARGVAAALRAQVRTAANDVDVVSTPAFDADRLPAGLEVAAYFCCLEAIQNAAKHAPGASVVVRLDRDADGLAFEVADDGPGFDPDLTGPDGSGVLGMRDRVAAVGGTLLVESSPGRGTTVRGRIPLA